MRKMFFVVLLLFVFVQIIPAQVTFETAMTSNGFYGNGAYTSTTKTFIQGDAKRTETEFKFTGAIMKHLSPKGTEIEITRLDKNVFWKFNDKKKEYTEIPFAQMKDMIDSGTSAMQGTQQGQETGKEQEAVESEYEWQEPKVEVKKVASNLNVNGFNCDQYLGTVTTVGKHKQTGVLDTMLFKSDIWSSKSLLNDMQTANDFEKRLAEALGFSVEDSRSFAQLMSQYKDQTETLMNEMKKIDGYPIKTDMNYTVTNHAMKSSQGEGETESEEEGDQIALDDIKGSLGGLFGKKLAQKASEKVAKPESTGAVEIFQFVSEVKNIKSGSIDSQMFEVPGNYKLKK
ncbi:hypothetical protein JXQ31_06870 [candidate division KSB1 bacterium]|nr:hypothetical protein [candidate division KSB1 bacterium]